MKRNVVILVIAAVLLAVGVLVMIPRLLRENPAQTEGLPAHAPVSEYYTCPMHPSVRSDRPGACPVCGMALVRKTVVADTMRGMGEVHGSLTLSPARQVLAQVQTTSAVREELVREIQAAGSFVAAESNTRRISARFPGRLEHLYLKFTGQTVRKGDRVADIYSPDAMSAQEEYLIALSASQAPGPDQGNGLQRQARQKLLRWGFTDAQIEELGRTRKVADLVTILSSISGTVIGKNVDPQQYVSMGEDLFEVADLSTVWLNVDIYEYEIGSLRIGESVRARTDAHPGQTYSGRITFISPTVDPAARTVRVRAEFANSGGELKPDMFANALISVQLPESVTVPVSAVLSTGLHTVVWVKTGEEMFEPREVKLGQRGHGRVQILDGINEGDTVVSSGGYLLDSESQLELPSAGKHQHAM